eukprot:TRINITY_DN3279_c0_g1_i7.p1 TRINITY_DN3279_c0_g1~~TRINITY_DN3279_c0_g1_i7.p1  ORF type:complete len:552 (+),score=107.38 TRINITY_DN3279_c0_g1_i7:149-1804(+)
MASESDNSSGSDDPDPNRSVRSRKVQKRDVRSSKKEDKGETITKKRVPSRSHRKKKKGHSHSSSSSEGSVDKNISVDPSRHHKRSPNNDRDTCQREISKEDEEIIHKEAELAQSFCKSRCSYVVEDSIELVRHLEDAYRAVSNSLSKPNVLVTGITGSGKSSLINSMFGRKVAETGSGVPITQHFTKYESDDLKTVIYDSKGLEHGQYMNFIKSTKAFFDEHSATSKDAIHVVWYIVNTAHTRFEPFEQELCEELFSDIPVFFLLNKSDISTEQDRNELRRIIEGMNLSNCCGILDVIGCPTMKMKSYDICPKCHSDDVTERRKVASMRCESCGYTESLLMDNGLEKVIKASLEVMPEVVRDNFVAAQNVSLAFKEEMAQKVITEFWTDFGHSVTYSYLIESIARMLARLSIVWEFKGNGQQVGSLLAGDLVTCLNWKRRFNLIGQEKKMVPSHSERLHLTSLGILWNLCLKELCVSLIKTWQTASTSGSLSFRQAPTLEISTTCETLFTTAFSAVNEYNLKAIELALLVRPLDEFLPSLKLQSLALQLVH